ncbi:3-methyl-2-oxobutanoate hydroxymethyltransferase [Acetomicrobium sp. UBA5826]|uniref:3-methyl-2-oxobutanoate hydroxymethyltransferase n=1 Tax=Acetomicrobium sp. UBA5826 TaxID=1946039 RepID=UPI00257E8A07|nr:3-methyl-2-oxobutanoate hydroxymethyltransferase [Acetomicrobium sp. UBA5826]
MSRVTVGSLLEMKERGEKITLLTAYDYPTAKLLDEAGIDILLVGDSLGNVVLGYENTLPVTLEESLHHTRAVARGTNRAMVVGDLPFLYYQTTIAEAVWNAGRYLKEAGAHCVKLEGGRERAEIVHALTETGIPVMAHLGLTPQSVNVFGGYRVQGKTEQAAQHLIEDAMILEEAGAFAVVLECIPTELAKEVTNRLRIPTLSCGAGPHCDGQVMVLHDLLGVSGGKVAKFVKQYANLHDVIIEALTTFKKEVAEGSFPGPEHCYRAKN